MSKTFQEIEISNGSWIKEQSDSINKLNENNFINLSEDTFRLFDAMIFISYNASPLMHALEFSKQSLEYRDYWEKSIDYIISDINLKEYNNKSKAGIETFILVWNIISNKSSYPAEIKKHLINEIINTIYDLEINSNTDFLNELNVLNLFEVNHNDLMENPIKENNLENKIFNKVNKFKTTFSYDIKIINENLSNEIKLNNNWIGKPPNTKRFCFSQNKYRFKIIINKGYKMINIAKRYIISKVNFYNSLLYIKNLKQDYKDLFKRELRNWLKAYLINIKISDNIIVKFSNNIIYDDIAQVKVDTKFDNSDKNSKKIEFISNKYLFDIHKNICYNKSKNYISKNN